MRIKTLQELLEIENWDQDEYEQCLLNLRDDSITCDMIARQLMDDSHAPQEDGVLDLIAVLSFQAGWFELFLDIDGDVWERLHNAVKEVLTD